MNGRVTPRQSPLPSLTQSDVLILLTSLRDLHSDALSCGRRLSVLLCLGRNPYSVGGIFARPYHARVDSLVFAMLGVHHLFESFLYAFASHDGFLCAFSFIYSWRPRFWRMFSLLLAYLLAFQDAVGSGLRPNVGCAKMTPLEC